MARLSDIAEPLRSHLAHLDCPVYDQNPWVEGPPLDERRIALVTTAGLHHRQDQPFTGMTGQYRVIPGHVATSDLVMSHISSNFDRTGLAVDLNVVFPLDRLHDLAAEGVIGSVATEHFSFMGAANPGRIEKHAAAVAERLHADRVTGVLLTPV